jgi:hypothetical protein
MNLEPMTLEQWKSLAQTVIPQLEPYAHKFQIYFNSDHTMDLLKQGEYALVHDLLEELWNNLPDSPEIRVGAFYPLCDLCTEFPEEE